MADPIRMPLSELKVNPGGYLKSARQRRVLLTRSGNVVGELIPLEEPGAAPVRPLLRIGRDLLRLGLGVPVRFRRLGEVERGVIERAPLAAAASAIATREARYNSPSISRAFEMFQFWQNLQLKLQPAVPNDSTAVPGRKWFKGFFSIGSRQNPDDRP
jgi:hypothetical protein